jgi:uncharacterized membrane protein YdbT with pleckstrin-like domain
MDKTTHHFKRNKKRLYMCIAVDLVLILLFSTSNARVLTIPLVLINLIYEIGAFFTVDITVAEHEVILKTAVLAQTTIEIPLNHINSVTIHKGILGQALDYGTVTINTGNDVSKIKIKHVDDPERLKRLLRTNKS